MSKCRLCGKKWGVAGLAQVVDAALQEGRKHEHANGAQVGTIVAQVQIKDLLEKVERGVCVKCGMDGMFEASACTQVRDAMRAALPMVAPAVPCQAVRS